MSIIKLKEQTKLQEIEQLVKQQREGYTLDQAFYVDPDIFQLEKERVIFRQWQFVDHVSRIPRKGDYFLFEIAGEELIIVRGEDDAVYAHFNTCRHRGSRVCLEKEGRRGRLSCPYHAWTYDLDGKLFRANNMPEDFDPEKHGLHSCPVRVFEGLIFIYLGKEEESPDFDYIEELLKPWISDLRLTDTKIAAIKHFPTPANWKLVVENFIECYHCRPSHPEYCATMAHVTFDADGTEAGKQKYQRFYKNWAEQAKAKGRRVGYLEPTCPDQNICAYHYGIGEGRVSTTKDGTPACNLLLGDLKERDGGDTHLAIGENLYLKAADDYSTLLHFKPMDTLETKVTLIFLVHKDAIEGKDYDVDKVTWLWDATVRQDGEIVTNNQRGILSNHYQPGPYSLLEKGCIRFTQNCLKLLATEERLPTKLEIDLQACSGEGIWAVNGERVTLI